MKGGALLAVLFVTGCGCTIVEPGHVGVVVNMTGDNRGAQDIPLQSGRVIYNPITKDVFEYPTFVQTASWTRGDEDDFGNEEISFNSAEALTITGDISLSYQLDPQMVPEFYVQFRSDDLDRFTHGYLRNVARDQFNELGGTYKVDDLLGPKREEFLTAVRERVNAEVSPFGVRLVQFGFLGAPRPPQNVLEAINAKVAATQEAIRAENELRREQANAAKAIARAEGEGRSMVARAEGESESNRLLSASINDQLIRWRGLENERLAIEKWNGIRPTVEAGAAAGMLLNLPSMVR